MLWSMREILGIAVVLWAASGHASPDVRSTIDALPEIATVSHGRTHVVIRGVAKRREIAPVVEQVIADVQRRFTRAQHDADPDITLCVFYRPDHRVAIANLGRSIGNLRHELVHPLIGDDFPGIPTWLNEGVAALYGSAKWNGRAFEFLVNYRLHDLQRALKDGRLPSLAELAGSTDADVHGPNGMMMYGYARYVLLFAERHGDLDKLYAELRDASGDTEKQRAVLLAHVDERAFRAWAAKLRY
jgi:hypothetical protein